MKAKLFLALIPLSVSMVIAVTPDATSDAKSLVKSLDNMLQRRFKTSDDGRFGISRMPVLSGHENILVSTGRPTDDEDTLAFVKRVQASGKPLIVGFAHINHRQADTSTKVEKPGKVEAIIGYRDGKYTNLRAIRGDDGHSLLKPFTKPINDRLKDIEAGTSFEIPSKTAYVAIRPVVTDRSCVQCHAGVKEDQSMGALVYIVPFEAVKPTQAPRKN
ncbi:MAG: hypothetical protein RL169_2018 [Armatimonadota bacterium]|jgi:hypothetical protein